MRARKCPLFCATGAAACTVPNFARCDENGTAVRIWGFFYVGRPAEKTPNLLATKCITIHFRVIF